MPGTTTVPLHSRHSADMIAEAVRQGREFKISTGNLSGGPVTPGRPGDLGRLGDAVLSTFLAESVYRADYVIRSYATPIAWRAEGEWFVPWHGYGVTTSKHQGRVRMAVSLTGDAVREMPHRYRVGLRHDGGHTVGHVTAYTAEEAVAIVMHAEGCPRRSITSVRWAD